MVILYNGPQNPIENYEGAYINLQASPLQALDVLHPRDPNNP